MVLNSAAVHVVRRHLEELGQRRRADDDVLAHRRRGDDADIDAARAGDDLFRVVLRRSLTFPQPEAGQQDAGQRQLAEL